MNTTPAYLALLSAALALPGVAATLDSQLSHYQEQRPDTENLTPLTVETLRVQGTWTSAAQTWGLSFSSDVWSGATPIATAPQAAEAQRPLLDAGVVVGASPLLNGSVLLDAHLRPLQRDPHTGQAGALNTRNTLILTGASPEIRQQLDLNFQQRNQDWHWGLNLGLSDEPDYQSQALNLQLEPVLAGALTQLQANLGYAHGQVEAALDPEVTPYLDKRGAALDVSPTGTYWRGVREEWTLGASLTQVLHKHAWLRVSGGWQRSQGLLEQPYRAVTVLFLDPVQQGQSVLEADRRAVLEQRPDQRDQWSLGLHYAHAFPEHQAALHLDYRHTQDDWAIRSHSLELQWLQTLGQGWTLTPRLRYYTQTAAEFYQPYLLTWQRYRSPVLDAAGREVWVDAQGTAYFRDAQGELTDAAGQSVDADAVGARPQLQAFSYTALPEQFASDPRLAAFSRWEAGLTVRKRLPSGLELQAGLNYAQRQADDSAEQYADFSSWSLDVGLSLALDQPFSAMSETTHTHGSLPAGLMAGHRLAAGRGMLGYRLMQQQAQGDLYAGQLAVTDAAVVASACAPERCALAPERMQMQMQMLELMYAPSAELTLMLMPQFVNMDMRLRQLDGADASSAHQHHFNASHQTGGLGDTLLAAYWHGATPWQVGLGLSLPTGSVQERLRPLAGQAQGNLSHYDMQLGSGTWDLWPSVSYQTDAWGMQVQGVWRLQDRNASGYRLGHGWSATAWHTWPLATQVQFSLRGVYTVQGALKGEAATAGAGPMDFASNTGGRFADLGLGISSQWGGLQLGLEYLHPVWSDFNGVQLERSGSVFVTGHILF